MFDDFTSNRELNRAAKRRFRASIVAAAVIFGASSAAAISAGKNAAHQAKIEEDLLQVDFKPKPPPPPPPAPEMPAPPPATPEPPKVVKEKPKPKIKPPTKLTDTKLAESDAPLPDLPTGGSGEGVPGGSGSGSGVVAPPPPPPPPPPPKPVPQVVAPLVQPVPASTPRPKYSKNARRKGIEGVVIVAFDVLETGAVANIKFISGPEELHETVLSALSQWHFKPASRGGHAVKFRMQQSFRFNLEDP